MTGEGAVPRLPSLRELVSWAEDASSRPVYPLFKRPDERAVTMRAFEHPAFVEEIARDLAWCSRDCPDPAGTWCALCEESSHRHDAYAQVRAELALHQ